MRIAYISNDNPEDINNWSGTQYHIISALENFMKWIGWAEEHFTELCGIIVFRQENAV